MEEQAPLYLPYGPCSECDILFPSQFHILSVRRDTELQIQSDNSLNLSALEVVVIESTAEVRPTWPK